MSIVNTDRYLVQALFIVYSNRKSQIKIVALFYLYMPDQVFTMFYIHLNTIFPGQVLKIKQRLTITNAVGKYF